MQNEQRDTTIDICRCLGIVLVVLGHSGAPRVLENYIYLFHMALFFALSGLCYKEKNDEKPIEYLISKIIHIYIPYVLYMWSLILLHNVFYDLSIYTSDESYLAFSFGTTKHLIYRYTWQDIVVQMIRTLAFAGNEQLGGATWFLRILFCVNIGNCLIRYIAKKAFKLGNVFQLVLMAISLMTSYFFFRFDIHLPLELQVVFPAYFAYSFGYFLKLMNWQRIDQVKNIYKFVASILLAALLFWLNSKGTIGLGLNSIKDPLFFSVCSISGILLTILVSKLLSYYCSSKVIALMGIIANASLSIVLWHFLAFKIITCIQLLASRQLNIYMACFPVAKSTWPWWIMYTIIGVFIPVIIEVLYLRVNKIMKRLYLIICKERNAEH